MPGFEPGRRLTARMPSTTFGIGGRLVAVEQGEDRVEVHVGAVLGHHRGDDPLGGALREQRLAICSIIRPVVRSDMPIATVPCR